MSDKTPSNPQPSDTPLGLAMVLGSLQSDHRHHVEAMEARFRELETMLAEERAARETRDAEITDLIMRQQDVLNGLADIVEPLVAEKTEKPKNDNGASHSASVETKAPTRARGEKNREFHTRLVAWARAQEYPEPPKPNGGEFPNAYDKRIAAWIEKVASS